MQMIHQITLVSEALDNNWVLYFNYTGVIYDIILELEDLFLAVPTKLGNIQNEVELGSFTKKAKRDIITVKEVNTDFTNHSLLMQADFMYMVTTQLIQMNTDYL